MSSQPRERRCCSKKRIRLVGHCRIKGQKMQSPHKLHQEFVFLAVDFRVWEQNRRQHYTPEASTRDRLPDTSVPDIASTARSSTRNCSSGTHSTEEVARLRCCERKGGMLPVILRLPRSSKPQLQPPNTARFHGKARASLLDENVGVQVAVGRRWLIRWLGV
eukprot:1411413-Rhodomonas_salina.2